MCVGGGGVEEGEGADAASKTTQLHMKGLDKIESPIFFCLFFVSIGNLLDFYFLMLLNVFFN